MLTNVHPGKPVINFLLCLLLILLIATPAKASDQTPPFSPLVTEPSGTTITPYEIPLGSAQVTIDGTCSPSEWGNSFVSTFGDGGIVDGGKVNLQQDGVYLYICITGIQGTQAYRYFRVYLDTDFGREENAQPEDIGLELDIETNSGKISSYRGNGNGNYKSATDLPGWTAAVLTGSGADTAEYKIPLSLTGGQCGSAFGIAVFHEWVDNFMNTYGWPSAQWFYTPNTWAGAFIPNRSCLFIPTVVK